MADDRQSARSRPSASSGFAELDDPDRTWIPTFRLKSLELASPAPKFSSPAARLGGASPRGWCSPTQNRLPMTSPSSPSARQSVGAETGGVLKNTVLLRLKNEL